MHSAITKDNKPKHKLEDYESGASRSEVMRTIGKYTKASKGEQEEVSEGNGVQGIYFSDF